MTSYFIINGRVIDPASDVDAKKNLHIRDGKIVEITTSKTVPDGAEVIDAKGCIVAPGFIDMHVHLRDPGYEYKEDIESGTKAAARGGFTSICAMPNTNPVNDSASTTEYILKRARDVGVVNVFPIGAISRGSEGKELADIGDMAHAGVVAVSDDGRPVMNSMLMRRAMEYTSAFKIPIIAHCEDLDLRGDGVMHEGQVSTELGLRGIPSEVETTMIARDIRLAELTSTPLHIAHLSAEGSLHLVECAKKRGAKVTAEVTPHHLTLTEEACADYDPNTKVNPPLRKEKDMRALIKGLADGTIDAIATDHAPHNITNKEAGFQEAQFGMIGLETMLPLVLKLVSDKKITMKRMISALTEAPARILNLKGKGALKKGYDADVVIFDPDHAWTIKADQFASKSRNTPFDGMRVIGIVNFTMVAGKIVFSR